MSAYQQVNDSNNNCFSPTENEIPFQLPQNIPNHLKDAVKEQAIKMWNYGIERGHKQWSLDDFEIGRHLGKGGVGRVYLARDKVAHSYVALKVINKSKIIKDKIPQQIVREIEIQGRLNHPNIVHLYTYFTDVKNVYLVLEYIGGGELFKHLRNSPQGRFSEITTTKYVYQVADALHYCHINKIIHRDIKPENLLLGLDGNVKLADFGFSVHTPSLKRKTVCGTVCYLPPEMIQHKYYNERIDNWCLGVLCYEFLVGIPPFGNKNEKQIKKNICSFTNITYPSYVGTEAQDFISNLLQRNPNARMSLPDVMKHKWIVSRMKIAENE